MLKIINGGKLPTKGSRYSACVDLYANADVAIGAGETILIPLGVCIDDSKIEYIIDVEIANTVGMDKGVSLLEVEAFTDGWLGTHYLQLMLRSSLSKHLIIANGIGIIDMDYKEEIMIRVHNPLHKEKERSELAADGEIVVKRGDRVAQIALVEHKSYLFDIESKEERIGGFGSTGEK